MMKFKLNCFLLPLLFALSIPLLAQDPVQDFKSMNEAYTKFENLAMDIDYRVFNNHTATAPIDQQSGRYKKRGNEYFTSLMGMETLVTTDKMFMLDTSIHKIVIKPAKSLSNISITGVDMEKILKLYKKVEFVKSDGPTKGYKIYLSDSVMSPLLKVEVYYDAQSYLIQKMNLFYRAKMNLTDHNKEKEEMPRLEITFSNIKTKPVFSKEEFKSSRYIQAHTTPVKPVARYKGYTIVELKN